MREREFGSSDKRSFLFVRIDGEREDGFYFLIGLFE